LECRKFNFSVCLIIKDEGDYIEEWLQWHIRQGVSHFYIYDNGSTPPIKTFIPNVLLGFCTIIDFTGSYFRTQIAAYDHCLKNFSNENEWIAFIDTDEFIRVISYNDIPEFLKTIPAEIDAVLLKWIVYGADGQIKKTNAPVRDRFHTAVNYPAGYPSCKSIIRPSRVNKMDVHIPMQSNKKELMIANEKSQRVLGAFDANVTCDDIVIDHYFTRSLEEWVEKIRRGSVDEICQRKYDLFFELNPDIHKAIESEKIYLPTDMNLFSANPHSTKARS